MASPKFYAVRGGDSPGVYRTWAECEPLVHGVKGVRYKSFPTEAEAWAFVAGEDSPVPPSPRKRADKKEMAEELPYAVPAGMLVAFVDGSYNVSTKTYGYGCVLLTESGEEISLSGTGNHPEAISARNVAGELQGTMVALKEAEKMGYKRLRICHDYNGIAAWFRGQWKANSFVAKQYIAVAESYRGVLTVEFEKIAAHTGVKYNEMADRLAKAAVGIED